ncbi:uncharacterized protein [Lepeophtheirus salmonis]|uniref:uncharacterized protein n=1 Tax=Lepeophtheirus salmonis TaxID=72036 RepID=UPI001AE5C867|nr:uncharacterized protein LOC121117688 [Lepeophtheirus salmonis]
MTMSKNEDKESIDKPFKISTALLQINTSNTGRKPHLKKSSTPKKRICTPQERENQQRIDRENRILLRKILEQHHGAKRRSSSVPPSSLNPGCIHTFEPRIPQVIMTSNQINAEKRRQKRDYENLLLLQKIQNAKPSTSIADSFKKTGKRIK